MIRNLEAEDITYVATLTLQSQAGASIKQGAEDQAAESF
jgi:hypothetical protein